ncbi:f-box-like domain-containing protein [Ditylenchus destructor]|nr:f-box-like domain-containing protein [Ditylenchus destructor]
MIVVLVALIAASVLFTTATRKRFQKAKSNRKVHQHAGKNINMLPDEVLVQIFEKLSRQERLGIEQVCKKWQHVGKDLSWSQERIFDDTNFANLPRVIQIKPFFERCGRYLRHLSFVKIYHSTEAVLSFIKMAPNVQHLTFLDISLTDESLKELAEIVPGLKSLEVLTTFPYSPFDERIVPDYHLGLMQCFKAMKSLEYLCIYATGALFDQHTFVQFPANLKYLKLYCVSNDAQILSWVADGCKNLRALDLYSFSDENVYLPISKFKSLTYLSMPLRPHEIGYVFEELTELRTLELLGNLDDTLVISAIAQHCKKVQNLHIMNDWSSREVNAEIYANTLRLTSLTSLRSLAFCANKYSKEQATEIVNRLIAKGKIQYINFYSGTEVQFEAEILLEILRRCKCIRYISLRLPIMDSDCYSRICQVVDEIDDEKRQDRDLTGESHQIVTVRYLQYNDKGGLIIENMTPYIWLRFTIDGGSPNTVCESWKLGWLSAGKRYPYDQVGDSRNR